MSLDEFKTQSAVLRSYNMAKISTMLHVKNTQTLNFHFDVLMVSVFRAVVFFTLICSCGAQPQLTGPSQPIVAVVGDDIILPCHLQPAVDASDLTVEWTRADLDPRFVHVLHIGEELLSLKHPLYRERTSLFIDELKNGNISLKLSKVKPADEGKYRCFIPELRGDSTVQLVVDAVSSPVIQDISNTSGKLDLQCESKGWYPEPEVLWLDAEGKILSAGPTETVRGPDDLYTVSSRVTVEKRHSNNITCRVQQRNINQTRETQIHVQTQSQLTAPSQPVVAVVGDDIILPCHLRPAEDASNISMEWTRPDLEPRFVHVLHDRKELLSLQHPLYRERTSLFIDELKNGNISLKLSKVKPADEGKYSCFIPKLSQESTVKLVVGAVSSPVVTIAEKNASISRVVLQCESEGWYPEPELLWLDAEGKILSAGPTETVRGPDDLYTVSSRVTVEKRQSNNITCRVQQGNINQIRETQIHVPGRKQCL
ncbi:butyrophilin-like protein 2 [Anabas testudineus]|uniref:butyrophilin-like protein 2 n=1 Tax=Anabas testudineus TaxID=64144 RepID=UPI000E465517|nr:butyrophilin-like protein 2 [Anabas testudineus]